MRYRQRAAWRHCLAARAYPTVLPVWFTAALLPKSATPLRFRAPCLHPLRFWFLILITNSDSYGIHLLYHHLPALLPFFLHLPAFRHAATLIPFVGARHDLLGLVCSALLARWAILNSFCGCLACRQTHGILGMLVQPCGGASSLSTPPGALPAGMARWWRCCLRAARFIYCRRPAVTCWRFSFPHCGGSPW